MKGRETIMIVFVLEVFGAGAIVVKVKFFKSSLEDLEKRKIVEKIREKRKERKKTGKPSLADLRWDATEGTLWQV